MARTGRGHFKIFLGMAAGVGKTYRMLQEGRAEAEAGRDVVIGYLEPHGRAETVAQADGLERLARRRVEYRGSALEEMDLPAIFRRAPDLCLIDELAHTNTPGVEHAKRYEDIADVLDAGIDVFSTVNVQHLETLNDQVAEMTGVRVRETFPDSVLASADEVVLMDLTPEALIERLRAGKIYPPERIEASLNNFFRIESLATLRELALRQVAQEVEAKQRAARPEEAVGTRERVIESAPAAVGERALALVTPHASSQRLVRRAWRSAQRLGAELDLLYVQEPGRAASAEEREQLQALGKLASVLGARMLIEEGDDIAEVAAAVGAERGTTYVLIGQPPPRTGLARLRESLPERLIRRMPGRRRADRRRPGEAAGERVMAPAIARATREPRPSAGSRGHPPDPVPVPGLGALRAQPRGDPAARQGTGRGADAGLPGARPVLALARSAAGQRMRGRAGAARADRAARRPGGGRGRLADRAGAHTAPRARVAAGRGGRSTRSSSQPARAPATASIPPTSPGCSSRRPARCWSCGPAPSPPTGLARADTSAAPIPSQVGSATSD